MLNEKNIQHKGIVGSQSIKERTYWLKKLSGELVKTNFPYDNIKTDLSQHSLDQIAFRFDGELFSRLLKLSNDSDVRLHIILMTGLVLLIYRYTDNSDVLVGTPIYRQETDGPLINTILALRNQVDEGVTFKELLVQVSQTLSEAVEYQNYPMETLLYKLGMPFSEKEDFPLFDVVLLLENIHDKTYCQQFNLNMFFNFLRKEDRIEGVVEYNPLLYEQATIERIINHMNLLLGEALSNLNLQLSSISIMSAEEKKQLLVKFNNTKAFYPLEKTIPELFQQQVLQTPHHIAVTGSRAILNSDHAGDTRQLIYQQLNQQANQLARVLREKGVKPNTVVGLIGEPSIELIVGMMGILKARAAYLPLDPWGPGNQMLYMLDDSQAPFILATSAAIQNCTFNGQFPERNLKQENSPREIIKLEQFKGGTVGESIENPEPINQPGDLVYIIFTSGSTGKPKGVMVEHRGLVNYAWWAAKTYVKNEKVSFPLFTSISFDLTVTSIFPPLITGNKIVIYNDENKELLIDRILEDNQVEAIKLTPSHLKLMCFKDLSHSRIKRLIVGGEELEVGLARDIFEKFAQQVEIFNEYGPTEAVVGCMIYKFNSQKDYGTSVPIGIPADNVQIYILASNQKPVPIGVNGEIYISGHGLARGYLNRPQLTAEKFMHNPFIPGAKLYRTGDLGKFLPDGNIQFLGRNDQQVKIRGYRIEPGGIESLLAALSNIQNAVVIARSDQSGNQYLCAYVVPVSGAATNGREQGINIAKLKEHLVENLPDYMIPSDFVVLDKIPLTANGKVNRQMLPAPHTGVTGVEYQVPGNDIEKKLAEVWSEVLGIERVGVNDNFFELRGDSIKTIQIAARLRKYQLKLEIRDLYFNPTIKQLAKFVKPIDRQIEQETIEGKVELTPIQRWFFERNFTARHHFNLPVMLYRKEGFVREWVENVFTKIVIHHDVLRMAYEIEGNNIVQRNKQVDGKLFDLEVIDFQDKEDIHNHIGREAARIQGGIDLSRGPLVKLGLFKTNNGDHLLVVIHHLVVDGISWRILLEDFASGYQQVEKGDEIKFPDKTDAFQTWSFKLKEYSQTRKALEELHYWKNLQEADIEAVPRDNPIENDRLRLKNSHTLHMSLDEKETETLLKEVNRAYNTEINDILLTALGLALEEWCGLQRVLINLEAHGREAIIEEVDISRTVGWFTAQFPVLLDMSQSRDLSYRIKYIKETLRRIPNKGIGYGILRYSTPEEKKEGIPFEIEPEISFNYLGEFGQELKEEKTTKVFTLSNMLVGDSISPETGMIYAVNINGMVVGKKLTISFSYNKFEYERDTIKQIVDCYKANLRKIIRHCRQKEKKELTPSDVGYNKISIEDFESVKESIEKKTNSEIKFIYPLTPVQNGMLLHSLIARESEAYFVQNFFHLKGDIDPGKLERSINCLIERYDILRTVFIHKELEEPVQVVLIKRDLKILFEDISHLSEDEKKHYLEKFKIKDKEKGIDWTGDMLMRISLFKTGEDSYLLGWSFHHIMIDGWSMEIIFKEFILIYQSLLTTGRPVQLAETTPFREYIKWLMKQDKNQGIMYWQKYLEGYKKLVTLPGAKKIVNENKYEQDVYEFVLDESLSRGLIKLAKENKVTINVVFQAIWGILLQRYNNTNDVVFGIVVSGRPPGIKDIETMVGAVINMIPMRISTENTENFPQLLRDVQQISILSKSYDYLPLADIHSNSALGRDLINHIMAFENFPVENLEKGETENIGNKLRFKVEGVQARMNANYDFMFSIDPVGNVFRVNFYFNSFRYERDVMKIIASHLKEVMMQLVENNNIPLKKITIDYRLMDAKSNAPKDDYTNFEL